MNEGGFTLIEILIAVTITGIILGAVFMFLHQGLFTWENMEEVGEWEQNWRVFDKRIKDDLNNLFYSRQYNENVFDGTYQGFEFLIKKDDILKKVSYTVDFYSNTIVRDERVIVLDDVDSGGSDSNSNSPGDNKIKREEPLNFFNNFNIYSVVYQYYDQENIPHNDWSLEKSDNSLPSFIEITISNDTNTVLPPVLAEIRISREYERGVLINE